MIKLILILAVLFWPCVVWSASTYYDASEAYTPPTSSGTIYYIDAANGNDSYDGTEQTHTTGSTGPFKTIGQALNGYANRGSGPQFLVKAGTYHEHVIIPPANYGSWPAESGVNKLILAAYGNGEVIIDGSVTPNLGTWSVYSGSVYQSTFSSAPVDGLAALVIDGDFRDYYPVASAAAITGPGMWYYDSAGPTLYVWTVGGTSPSGRDVVAVENNTQSNSYHGVFIQNQNTYVTVSNLTIRGHQGYGVFIDPSYTTDHITVTRCKIEFNAYGGLSFSSTTNASVTKNYIYANVIRNWPRGKWTPSFGGTCAEYTAGGWPSSCGCSGCTNHYFAGNIVGWSNGEGIIFGDQGAGGYGIAENNIVHDSFSTNMYFDHGYHATFRNNLIYSTGFVPTDITGTSGCTAGDISGLERRSRAAGIASANESYYSAPPIGTGNAIYNNLILGTRVGISSGDETSGGGLINENWYSNTIILPNYNPAAINDTFIGISVSRNSGNNSGSNIKNNIILGQEAHGLLTNWPLNGEATDTGITWNDNLYYHPNNATPLQSKGTAYGFTNWKTQTGQDASSVNSNPMLNRTDWSTLIQ